MAFSTTILIKLKNDVIRRKEIYNAQDLYNFVRSGGYFDDVDRREYIVEVLMHGKIEGRINGLFIGCKELTKVVWDDLDTSRVTSLAWVFADCESLEKIDLSKNSFKNVTHAHNMFQGCTKLKRCIAAFPDDCDTENMFRNSLCKGVTLPDD